MGLDSYATWADSLLSECPSLRLLWVDGAFASLALNPRNSRQRELSYLDPTWTGLPSLRDSKVSQMLSTRCVMATTLAPHWKCEVPGCTSDTLKSLSLVWSSALTALLGCHRRSLMSVNLTAWMFYRQGSSSRKLYKKTHMHAWKFCHFFSEAFFYILGVFSPFFSDGFHTKIGKSSEKLTRLRTKERKSIGNP